MNEVSRTRFGLFSDLGIDLDAHEFYDQRLQVTDASRSLILDKLSEQMGKKIQGLKPSVLSKRQNAAIVRSATFDLRGNGHLVEAVLLGTAAQTTEDFGPLIAVLHSLQLLGARKDLEAQFERIDKNWQAVPDAAVGQIDRIRFSNRLGLTVESYERRWGTVPESLAEGLEALKALPVDDPEVISTSEALIKLRNLNDDEPKEFQRRLNWSRHVIRYLNFIAAFGAAPTSEDPDPRFTRLKKLRRNYQELFLPIDDDLRADMTRTDRSTMIVCAHAGVSGMALGRLNALANTPKVTVGNSQNGVVTTDDVTFFGTLGSNVTRDFLRVTKQVKGAPHRIGIFPDGRIGQEMIDTQLLGQSVQIGAGAASLGWHSRAITYFLKTEWVDHKIRLCLEKGPDAADFETRDAFQEALVRFYAQQCEKIVLGDPINMHAVSGFWGALTAPQRAAMRSEKTLEVKTQFVSGLPHLDIHTLSEDWVLAFSGQLHWKMVARSLGRRPSEWIDTQGDRMYSAFLWLSTRFDLDNPLSEDQLCKVTSKIIALRKPHALSVTQFMVEDTCVGEVRMLTSLVKRDQKGSNKKFSKTRDLWTAEDYNSGEIETLLDRHHACKAMPDEGEIVQAHRVNRITDFNIADMIYFKNFVRIAKAAEWVENRSAAPRLNDYREAFFYGNADDGDLIETRVARDADTFQSSHHLADGRRIFLSFGTSAVLPAKDD